MKRASFKNQAGFTLMEMLIALFIFSIISVGSMSALTQSIRAKDQIDVRLESLNTLDTARAIMAADMANIVLRDGRDILGSPAQTVLSSGEGALLRFTRAGRINPAGAEPRGDLQRVTYAFDKGQLVRRALAHENPTQTTANIDRILLDGIEDIDISFLTGNQTVRTVRLPRGTTASAPDAIILNIVFDDGRRLSQWFELS